MNEQDINYTGTENSSAQNGGAGSTPQGPAPHINSEQEFPPNRKKQRERRVGTITMGVCLIVTGIILIIYLFNPSFNLYFVSQFSPVILVLLGVEILYSHFVHRGDRIRYDFLSMFFCTILILCSMSISIAVPLYREFGPAKWEVLSSVENQIYDLLYGQLSHNPNISSMNVNISLNSVHPDTDSFSYTDMTSADHVNLHFQLNTEPYSEPQGFAQDCSDILRVVQASDININSVSFIWSRDKTEYRLQLSDRFSMNQPAEKLASMVEISRPEPEWDEEYAEETYNEMADEAILDTIGESNEEAGE